MSKKKQKPHTPRQMGAAGGASTLAKYGRDHYREMARRSAEARRAKREAAARAAEGGE